MQNIIKNKYLYIWKINKRNSIKNLFNYIKPMKNLSKCIFKLNIKLYNVKSFDKKKIPNNILSSYERTNSLQENLLRNFFLKESK